MNSCMSSAPTSWPRVSSLRRSYGFAMPVAPAPVGREYADRLMTAAQRQSAEWAKAGAKGAQKDLQKTIDSLRGQLSAEELAALLKDLQGGANAGGPADAQASAGEPPRE